MSESSGLYELHGGAAGVPAGLPLVAGLTGFVDAGSAVSQFTEYLIDTLENRVVATFDNEELLDYRSRRPTIYFDQDHLSNYEPPRLILSLMTDDIGQQFLLLSGYEPDFRWEGFSRALLELIDVLQVGSTTWLHSIPMPVPHTRPIGVTVSGNRAELIEAKSVWRPHTTVPANVLHLLEFRLQQTTHPTAGFVLLIPHYLADTEFPDAAVAALDSISAATGLIFPTDQLRVDGRDFIGKIAAQVADNHELARLVGALEQRHDAYMEGNAVRSPLMDEDGELPTADEIAAELEKFLATPRPDDTGGSAGADGTETDGFGDDGFGRPEGGTTF